MIEQEKHAFKGQRARIKACHAIHSGAARGNNYESCVCSYIGKEVILGNRLIIMSPAPDTFRVEVKGFQKLVRLDEIALLS